MGIKNRKRLFILLDSLLIDYVERHGMENFDKFINKIRRDLSKLCKENELILLTRQDLTVVNNWLIGNKLHKFFDQVNNFPLN